MQPGAEASWDWELSASELKAQLYEQLKSSGALNTLKVSLGEYS